MTEKTRIQHSRCVEKKCQLKCHTRVTEEQKESLFTHYLNNLCSYQRQQDYLAAYMNVGATKRKTVGKKVVDLNPLYIISIKVRL